MDAYFLLWLIAVVCVIYGVVQIIHGQLVLGIVLIVVGLLIGPGGYSVFRPEGGCNSATANCSGR